jgi:hypothetical protein
MTLLTVSSNACIWSQGQSSGHLSPSSSSSDKNPASADKVFLHKSLDISFFLFFKRLRRGQRKTGIKRIFHSVSGG